MDSTKIINLSINEKEFSNQISRIISYMDIFEDHIEKFEKKINSLNISNTFNKIDANLSKTSNNINKHFNNIDTNLNSMSNTMDNKVINLLNSLNDKFSLLGVTGLKVINNISDAFLNMSKNLVKSMTDIDNITSAYSKWEIKNNAIRTIMNSVLDSDVPAEYASKIEYVTEALSKLETFSDETSYDFTQMTNSIGRLTALGNTLEQASDTVMGMASWNSLVGKSARDFETLSYAIERMASLGYLNRIQYSSLSNYLGPQTKKDILNAAAALGTLNKTGEDTFSTLKGHAVDIGSFNNNLADQWLTMPVMNKVMGEYSEFANDVIDMMKANEDYGMTASEAIKALEDEYRKAGKEVSVNAFKSAQEAKNFGEAFESVRVAVQTGWAKSFEYIFGNVEEASQICTDLANQLFEIFADGKYVRNELLKLWSDAGGRDTLFAALLGDLEKTENGSLIRIGGLISYIKDIINEVNEAIADVFGLLKSGDEIQPFADRLLELTKNFKDFINSLKPTEETLKHIREVVYTISLVIKNLINIIRESSSYIIQFLTPILDKISSIGLLLNRVIYTTINRMTGPVNKLINSLNKILAPVLNVISTAILIIYRRLTDFISLFSYIIDVNANIVSYVSDLISKFSASKQFKEFLFNAYKLLEYIGDALLNVVYYFSQFAQKIASIQNLKDIIDAVSSILTTIFDVIKKIGIEILKLTSSFKSFIQNTFKLNDSKKIFNTISSILASIIKSINELLIGMMKIYGLLYYKIKDTFPKVFKNVVSKIQEIFPMFKKSSKNIGENMVEGLIEGIKNLPNTIAKFFEKVIETVKNIFGIHSPSLVFMSLGAFIVSGLALGIKNNIIKVPKEFQPFLDSIVKFFNDVKNKIQEIFPNIMNIINNIKNAISNTFSNFGKKSSKFNILGTLFDGLLKMVNTAIPFLAGLINSVGKFAGLILQNNNIFIVIASILGVQLFKTVKDVSYSVQKIADIKISKNISSILFNIALIIAAIAGALYVISKIPILDLAKSVLVISAIVFVLATFIQKLMMLQYIKVSVASPLGIILLSIVATTIFLTLIVKEVSKFPIAGLLTVIAVMAGLIIIISIISDKINVLQNSLTISSNDSNEKESDKGLFKNIMTIATDFRNIISAISLLIGLVNQADLGTIIATFVGMTVLIGVLYFVLGQFQKKMGQLNQNGGENGGALEKIFGNISVPTLTAASLAINTLASALQNLAHVPIKVIVTGFAGLGASLAILGYYGKELASLGPFLQNFSLSLIAFALSISLLSNPGMFVGLIGFAGALFIVYEALSYFLAQIDNFKATTINKLSTTLISLSISIAIISASILLLSKSGYGIGIFIAALAALFVILTVGITIISKFSKAVIDKFSSVLNSISLMSLAIGAAFLLIATALNMLSNISGTAIIAILGISAAVFALAIALNAAGIAPLLSGIGNILGGIGSAIQGVVNILKDFDLSSIGNIFSGIPKMLMNAGPSIINASKEIGNFLSSGLMEGIKNLPQMIGDLFIGIIDVVKNIFGIHSPSLVFMSIGGFLISGLVLGIKQALEGGPNPFQPFLDSLEELKNQVLTFIDTMKNLMFSPLEQIKEVKPEEILPIDWSGLSVQIENIKTTLIEPWNNISALLGEIIVTIKDTILAIVQFVTAPFVWLVQTVKGIINLVVQIINAKNQILQASEGPKKNPFQWLANIAAFLGQVFNDIFRIAGSIVNGIVGIFRIFVQIIRSIVLAIRVVIMGISMAIKGFFDIIGKLIEIFMPKDPNAVEEDNFFAKIGQAIKDFWDFWITNGLAKVFEKIAQVINDIANGWKDFNDKMAYVADTGDFMAFFQSTEEVQKKIEQLNKQREIDLTISANGLDEIPPKFEVLERQSDGTYKKVTKTREEYEKQLQALSENSRHQLENGIDLFNNLAKNGRDITKEYTNLLVKDEKEADKYLEEQLKKFTKDQNLINKIMTEVKKNGGDVSKALSTVSDEIGKSFKITKQIKENLDEVKETMKEYSIDFSKDYKKMFEEDPEKAKETLTQDLLALGMLPEAVKKVVQLTAESTDKDVIKILDMLDGFYKEAKDKEDKYLKAHKSFLSNYKETLDDEKALIKAYAQDRKKIWDKNYKNKVDDQTRLAATDEFFQTQAETDLYTFLDLQTEIFKQEDENWKNHLDDLDENMSAEDKKLAIRAETFKKLQEDYKSGFNFDEMSPSKSFEKKKFEGKPTDAINNVKSYLNAWTDFKQGIEYLAGTNISDELLLAAWQSGPNGDTYLALESMKDNELMKYDEVFKEYNDVKNKGVDSLFYANLIAKRKELQANHISNDAAYDVDKLKGKKAVIDVGGQEVKVRVKGNQYVIDKEEYDKAREEMEEDLELTSKKDEEDLEEFTSTNAATKSFAEVQSREEQALIDAQTGPGVERLMTQAGAAPINSISQGMIDSIPAIQSAAQQIQVALENAFNNSLIPLFDELGIKLSSSITNAFLPLNSINISSLQDLSQAASQTSSQVSAFTNTTAPIAESLSQTLSNPETANLFIANLLTSLSDNVGLLVTIFASVLANEQIKTLLMEPFIYLGTLFTDIMTQAIATLSEKIDNVFENTALADVMEKIIEGMIQRCLETLEMADENTASTRFKEIGVQIINGLLSGIESNGHAVSEAMVKVLSQVSDDAEDSEEVNSPSKKWARFGGFLMQGMANGIEDNASSPLNAMATMLSHISDNMELDDNYNPVITPVIDLSQAEKQSKSISTLFANQQAISISSNLLNIKSHQNGGENDPNSSKNKVINFTQNNYSPKALSREEIYRQTRNQFSQIANAT